MKKDTKEEAHYKLYSMAPLVADHITVNLFGSLGVINFRSMLPELFGDGKEQTVQLDASLYEVQPHTRIAMDREVLKNLRDQLNSILSES